MNTTVLTNLHALTELQSFKVRALGGNVVAPPSAPPKTTGPPSPGGFFRVRVGAYESMLDAKVMKAELMAAGHKTAFIPPDARPGLLRFRSPRLETKQKQRRKSQRCGDRGLMPGFRQKKRSVWVKRCYLRHPNAISFYTTFD